jgi:hypothetical protein
MVHCIGIGMSFRELGRNIMLNWGHLATIVLLSRPYPLMRVDTENLYRIHFVGLKCLLAS